MKKIQVFDPPMCCSTGVCGPSVDPVLPQFASDLEWIKGQGVEIERYNLAQQPHAFAGNGTVKATLGRFGTACLPLVLLDDEVVHQGSYPSRERLCQLLGLPAAGPAGPAAGSSSAQGNAGGR